MDPTLSKATRVPQLDITNGILYALATIAVGLRFYTRSRIIRKVIAGDWWMLGAWVLATGQYALWTYYDSLGNAQHIWNLNPANLQQFFLVCWIIQLVYPFGLGVIKISVLFLYHELFPSDNFRTVIFCVMGFHGAMTIASCLAFVFQCTPVQSYWVMSLWGPGDRHCVNEGALSIASSSLSMGTDIIILLLPMKYLLALRISMREKIQVILLMSLGGLTCIASVMRFKAIRKVYRSKDATWDGYDLSFWSSFEYMLAIITACIPTIKPLYVKCVRKLLALIRGDKPITSQETDDNFGAYRPKFVQPEPKLPV
ncbi:hypothetical protein N431DRAFT_19177 [Stipitochalara longipes BDJ]|nr:hypothetical protein N431DRAFT_19177 [Stipitochalara longipes BDJ]